MNQDSEQDLHRWADDSGRGGPIAELATDAPPAYGQPPGNRAAIPPGWLADANHLAEVARGIFEVDQLLKRGL